ncbi:MAG: hypothetical protein ACRDP6_48890 [Actinoallomurus sp.]
MTDLLIDPDCRDGKCGSCVGGPCEHDCHTPRWMLEDAGIGRPATPTAPVTGDLLAENARLSARLEEADGNVSAQWERKVKAEHELAVAREQVAALQREAAFWEAGEYQGELIRLRNRVKALESNGAELLARTEKAEAERDAAGLIVAELQALRDSLYKHLDSAQQCAEAAEAERDALKATVERVREMFDPFAGAVFAILTADGWKPVLDAYKVHHALDASGGTESPDGGE